MPARTCHSAADRIAPRHGTLNQTQAHEGGVMTNRHSRRTTTALAASATAVLLALTSCSTPDNDAPPLPTASDTPTASEPSTTTAPSPTATMPASPEEQAVADAEAAARRYYAVMNELISNPTADENKIKDVTVATGQVDAYNRVDFNRSRGQQQIGDATIVDITSTLKTLEFEPTQQPPTVPTVEIAVCYDVSAVNVIDASGKSVVTADRKDRAVERLVVTNYSWPDKAGWKVASSEVKGEACTPTVT